MVTGSVLYVNSAFDLNATVDLGIPGLVAAEIHPEIDIGKPPNRVYFNL